MHSLIPSSELDRLNSVVTFIMAVSDVSLDRQKIIRPAIRSILTEGRPKREDWERLEDAGEPPGWKR